MAENDKITNNMKEFRRSPSPAAASVSRTGGPDSFGKHVDSQKKKSQLRQPSVIGKPNIKTDDKQDVAKSPEERCERAKLLREKQMEERKKKHDERKTAVEERRRQKEKNEGVKNDSLRDLVGQRGHSGTRVVGTGRKLPNLPADGCYPRRLSSGSSSGDSPGHTPPGSAKGGKTSRRDLTGPSSASTSCLSNVGNGRVHNRTKSNMSKKTSVSTNNLMDHALSTKPVGKIKEKTIISIATRESLLPKTQSTGAIHQVGSTKHHTSRLSSGKKTKSKSTTVHHAGKDNPEDAKRALAEHRKKIREEAERQALLDKEKQEELRKQREEEEKCLAEENAIETARQQELAKLLKEQEEERADQLREQREREEAERIETETRRKQELEMLKKLELERRAKEVEKWEREEEERLRRDEEERQERRKRVETIMSRTRLPGAMTTNNNFKTENCLPQEDLATKSSLASDDFKYHSTTVSEILQKVKEKSRACSPNPEQDAEKHKENIEETAEKHCRNDNGTTVLQTMNDVTSKLGSLISEHKDEGDDSDSCNIVSLPLRQHDNGEEVTTRNSDVGDTTVGGKKTNLMNSLGSENDKVTKPCNADLWDNVEDFMQSSESDARDSLERNGAIAEDEDDEDGEEGQLWKVVEGRREIADVV